MSNLDQDPQEWLRELFEHEYCDECGGDAEHHDAVPFESNWFARCHAAYYAVPAYDRPELPSPTPPATEWFWQSGNRWVAVVGEHEAESWWEGADPADIAARPDPWRLPIDTLPPSGVTVHRTAPGTLEEWEV